MRSLSSIIGLVETVSFAQGHSGQLQCTYCSQVHKVATKPSHTCFVSTKTDKTHYTFQHAKKAKCTQLLDPVYVIKYRDRRKCKAKARTLRSCDARPEAPSSGCDRGTDRPTAGTKKHPFRTNRALRDRGPDDQKSTESHAADTSPKVAKGRKISRLHDAKRMQPR